MAFAPNFSSQFLGTAPSSRSEICITSMNVASPSTSPSCSIPFPRRAFLALSASSIASLLPTTSTNATTGLHLFPLQQRLTNTYFLMRSCETVSDARNIVNTNPVNKLSIEKHSLTRAGVDQAHRASQSLEKAGLSGNAWLWPSVTINAFETAEILASNLSIRREQIVPEFSFLDARGLGALEGGTTSEVRRLVQENDGRDPNWRPMPGQDGTPNDSSEDVFVRVRQLLSKLETQYFGENIVIISPDSDPLSILQASLTGKDLRAHHSFEFLPGEVRRIQELVVDSFGEVVIHPDWQTLSKPKMERVG